MNSRATRKFTIPEELRALVAAALREDLGPAGRDLTSEWTLEPRRQGVAVIAAQAAGVLSGAVAVEAVFAALQRKARRLKTAPVRLVWKKTDGDSFKRGEVLAGLYGPLRLILLGERTALNFLQYLSGIATQTRQFSERVRGTRAKILDTRKTLPGYRALAKKAVRDGGGHNHRQGLYDAVLIKNNHVDAVGGVGEALRRVLKRHSKVKVQVEVRNRREFDEAIAAGAKSLLLDNLRPGQIRPLVRACPRGVELEVSGGISLKNVRAYAQTGVDRISVGCLTHSVPSSPIHLVLRGRI